MELSNTISKAVQWLESKQSSHGYWMGRLESNSCMEAEWILAMHFLGLQEVLDLGKLARGILQEQRADGAWETYKKASHGDINTTVESYVALRAAGLDPDSEVLSRARQWIENNGGPSKVRVFTRYWLALIGEWPWSSIPVVPPEMIFFPDWFPLSIYNFASWARATILPLSILSARQPVRPLPERRRPRELFADHDADSRFFSLQRRNGLFSWEGFFHLADSILRHYQRLNVTPGRETAIKLCLEWVLRHQEGDGAWAGIQPPWIYSLLALNVEGYHLSQPVLSQGTEALKGYWSYESGDSIHIQACNSPVWDTVLSLMALTEGRAGFCSPSNISSGVDWLLEQQILEPGDWQVKVRGIEPGGWAFEHSNLNYPDIDDTAVALLVLSRVRKIGYHDPERLERAIKRGRDWILAMQSRNGGWAAFDKDNTSNFLTKIPFCDFGEVLDPPSVDVTAHVLEALGHLDPDRSHPAVGRGVEFIRKEQEPDGCWFGRWGVNYIYGTGAVLPALQAVGEDMTADYVRRAADWLVDRQNPDGGWGESCESYMADGFRGRGRSTPSQTGWAILGLTAVGKAYLPAVQKGIDFLISRNKNGTWNEPQYTGTGFPGYGVGAKIFRSTDLISDEFGQGTELSRGFMIKYHMYCHYFPLMALERAGLLLNESGRDGLLLQKIAFRSLETRF
ncbi:MAG: squalene--hopene cyclase [Desulfohalobiaceae bacterium]|nr:squalene--hopene cyclase [Desulfohalobiaceae bacterium]